MRILALLLFAAGAFAQTAVVNGWGGSGGTTVAAAPPYISVGGTKYLPGNMYAVTLLNTSGWAFFQGSGTITAGANGEVKFQNTGTSQAWAHSGTVSSFTQLEWAGNFDIASASCNNSGTDWVGVYAYDSANGIIDGIGFQTNQPGRVMSLTATWTGSTAAAPASNTFSFVGQGIGYPAISLVYRASINSGAKTITYSKSVNGGKTFDSFFTTSAATNTPTWTDVLVMSACGDMTVYSLKTQ